MSSEIKANKWSPATGTAATLGDSGDTFTIPAGATIANSGPATGFGGDNTPAFMAYMTSGMTPSSNTWTKVTCATEVFDSDSAYDNSTNYRFTVPAGEGGKYYVYGSITMYTGGYAQMVEAVASIYLNGAQSATTLSSYFAPTTNYGYGETPAVHGVMNLSASDYIELWGSCATSSGTPTFAGTTSYVRTYFGAHKLIGV